jgi:hypothetical protein
LMFVATLQAQRERPRPVGQLLRLHGAGDLLGD